MRRSQRLQVVLDLEQRREQAALEEFQAAQEALRQQQARLHELERYHSEYQQQMREATRGTMAVRHLQAGQEFISQLASAIAQQQTQMARYEQRVEQAREEWRQAWERREGMARYIGTCRESERREDDRLEQKALDEAANQRFARAMRQ